VDRRRNGRESRGVKRKWPSFIQKREPAAYSKKEEFVGKKEGIIRNGLPQERPEIKKKKREKTLLAEVSRSSSEQCQSGGKQRVQRGAREGREIAGSNNARKRGELSRGHELGVIGLGGSEQKKRGERQGKGRWEPSWEEAKGNRLLWMFQNSKKVKHEYRE